MQIFRRYSLKHFLRAQDGVTAIEFAFIAPIVLLFIFGTLEFAWMFFAENVLENAANAAARTGKTGYIAANMTREQYILQQITKSVGNLLDPALIKLTTRNYKAFDDVGEPEPYIDKNNNGHYDPGETFTDKNKDGVWSADSGASGAGNERDIVVYDVTYPWKIMTPFIANVLGNGKVTLGTRLIIRNEPFNGDSG